MLAFIVGRLMEEFCQIAILITNQVQCNSSQQPSELQAYLLILINCTADPGATMTFVAGGALKPIGGHILSHASATRIFLRKGRISSFFRTMASWVADPCHHATYGSRSR